MRITVEMDAADFMTLCVNSMQWAGQGWHDQPDRFRPYRPGEHVDWRSFQYAYWFDSPSDMILAREYLRAAGEPFQVLWDEAGDGVPYLIVTNYEFRKGLTN
jgi:hypothetical protein